MSKLQNCVLSKLLENCVYLRNKSRYTFLDLDFRSQFVCNWHSGLYKLLWFVFDQLRKMLTVRLKWRES